ncbi:glycosyltransferase family 2 protein [Methylomonas rhizoryzae]|uniref:glycosyltransferase family 2 protein n=1 Tax=Methylomonas rhizoryzae TaxID=2608981 RepID=UPI001232B8D1|nr:glycosyltransferase family 2 protein [Methylomonas rhizoryzae]
MSNITPFIAPRILAIMVNWNGKEFLPASVSSVLNELAPINGQLLLVDNASSDGSVEYIKANFPSVEILQHAENLGGAGGFSAGMRVALTRPEIEYVWLLDNDVIVEKGALGPLIDCLDAHVSAGAVGSQICLYHDRNTVQEIGGEISPWLGALRQNFSCQPRVPAETNPYQVGYLAACSVLIRRSCLAQVGTFADLFVFYDDVEWGLRAKKAGWTLWAVPASVIRHNYSETKPIVPWREYYRKRNRLAMLAVYPPKHGKQLASLVYIVYINYLIYLHCWLKFTPLDQVYILARNDALKGCLGKRSSAIFESYSIDSIKFDALGDKVLIDVGDGAGELLKIVDLISKFNSNLQFFMPKKYAHYLRLFSRSNVRVAIDDVYSSIIIGKSYSFLSLFYAKTIYRVAGSKLEKISVIDCMQEQVIRLAALTASCIVSPWHWFVLQFKYYGKKCL